MRVHVLHNNYYNSMHPVHTPVHPLIIGFIMYQPYIAVNSLHILFIVDTTIVNFTIHNVMQSQLT